MLFKLRIVCKEWNALPNLPYFCDSHIGDQRPSSNYLLRFQNEQLKNGEVCNLESKKFVKMDFAFVLDAIRNNSHLNGSKIKVRNVALSGSLFLYDHIGRALHIGLQSFDKSLQMYFTTKTWIHFTWVVTTISWCMVFLWEWWFQ